MSQINEEQKDKKEQPLETPQNIKKPKGLEPASDSPWPDWLAGFLAVCIVVVMGMIISQIATTATTSKSQQSANESVCPDGYDRTSRSVYLAQDFIEGTIDSKYGGIVVVGWLAHADWSRHTADLCMDAACQGPSKPVFLNPRLIGASMFHQAYVQHRTMSNFEAAITIENGEVVGMFPQYFGGNQIWMRKSEHEICIVSN